MIKAKDIVAKEVARQAAFGYEPSWEDFVIAGYKAGIKEAVEWIRVRLNEITCLEDSADVDKALTGLIFELKAQLKEWGL